MVNYACGFSQSELGKYFEWTIIDFNITSNALSNLAKGSLNNWNVEAEVWQKEYNLTVDREFSILSLNVWKSLFVWLANVVTTDNDEFSSVDWRKISVDIYM